MIPPDTGSRPTCKANSYTHDKQRQLLLCSFHHFLTYWTDNGRFSSTMQRSGAIRTSPPSRSLPTDNFRYKPPRGGPAQETCRLEASLSFFPSFPRWKSGFSSFGFFFPYHFLFVSIPFLSFLLYFVCLSFPSFCLSFFLSFFLCFRQGLLLPHLLKLLSPTFLNLLSACPQGRVRILHPPRGPYVCIRTL
jgi:hypothetical protein